MMPILPAEPELYPTTLWDEDRSHENGGARWWCAHTKPRQEKALARTLHKQGISYYLPLIGSESRTPGGRKIRSLLPLFPGYLFLHGDDFQRVEAMQGNHLARVLHVVDQDALERDLRQLHRLLAAGLPVAPEPSHVVGTRIRITSGPLQGLVGTVVRRGGQDRFTALVRFLGRGATVELRDWQAEPEHETSVH